MQARSLPVYIFQGHQSTIIFQKNNGFIMTKLNNNKLTLIKYISEAMIHIRHNNIVSDRMYHILSQNSKNFALVLTYISLKCQEVCKKRPI